MKKNTAVDNITAVVTVLSWLKAAFGMVMLHGFQVKAEYPKSYGPIREYLRSIKPRRLNRSIKFIGCLVYPADYIGKHNHFIIIDDGVISDFIKSQPYASSYKAVSLLVLRHILGYMPGLDSEALKVHVHVINYRDLSEVTIEEIKRIVIAQHPSLPTNLQCRLAEAKDLSADLRTVTNHDLFRMFLKWNNVL